MTKDQKEQLFTLIKSLTKSEKRQFKLYVNRMGSNFDSKFLNLFNFLEKSDSYDEKSILSKEIVSKQQLSNLKAHLYKQILISLRLNPAHKNIRLKIREQIDFATILYQKGLYKQSLKLLEKAKNLALKNEEKYTAFDIVELEKVIESQYITRSLSNRSEILISQADKLIMQNDLASKLSNLSLRLYERFIKSGYAKSDDEFREITRFFYKRLPKIDSEEIEFREKLWYYKAHVWYSFLIQDFLSSYKYSSKWVDMFENNPKMISIHPVFYLKGNNYLLESLTLIKYPQKFELTLDKLIFKTKSPDFPVNENLETLIFLYKYNNLLNYYNFQGDFEKAKLIVSDVLLGIDRFKSQIDPHHIMVFYYKIACLYFGLSEHENCILYLNKIISNRHLKMREDLLCFTRVLNLVAHYEAGFDYHLDIHIRETYRFLIKMNDMHEVQKAMIRFVKKLGELYPQDLKKAFIDLHRELKIHENDPYERRSFLYLDILSWLESNIYNKPIGEIIREKAKLFNRKKRTPRVPF